MFSTFVPALFAMNQLAIMKNFLSILDHRGQDSSVLVSPTRKDEIFTNFLSILDHHGQVFWCHPRGKMKYSQIKCIAERDHKNVALQCTICMQWRSCFQKKILPCAVPLVTNHFPRINTYWRQDTYMYNIMCE